MPVSGTKSCLCTPLQIFDQFAKARIKEESKERKNKLQQAKEEFRKLLEESKITSKYVPVPSSYRHNCYISTMCT